MVNVCPQIMLFFPKKNFSLSHISPSLNTLTTKLQLNNKLTNGDIQMDLSFLRNDV